jgi:hypothetical protein
MPKAIHWNSIYTSEKLKTPLLSSRGFIKQTMKYLYTSLSIKNSGVDGNLFA